MFLIDCPDHNHRVLVPSSRVRQLHNTEGGILLTVECWCGAQVRIRTGARARASLRLAA